MKKEEFRAYVMTEEPIPKLTPEEAFQAGKRGDMSGYDAAGRACARAIIKFGERHPDRWERIQSIYRELRRFRNFKFSSPEHAQEVAERILRDNGVDRFRHYPDWTHDRLSIHPGWDIQTARRQLSQGIVLAAIELLHELADDELNKQENEIGPTGFMWSWALNSAIYLTSEVEAT